MNKLLINKTQDAFLKHLNVMAKMPEDTKYNLGRQVVKVSKETYSKMMDCAMRYGEFISKMRIPKTVKYNEQWLFDVIERYFAF